MEASEELQPGMVVLHGNRLESLRSLVVEWVRRAPPAPLENETVLVQSNGMAQWLRHALAADPDADPPGCGIAAALDMQLPSRFIWSAYRAVLGAEAVPLESPFAKRPLLWRLMRLLPALLQRPAFAPLAEFLRDDGPEAGGDLRKRYQLAERLADLFDQYQVYRADWLADWADGRDVLRGARGEEPELAPEQRWQAELWRALLDDVGDEHAGVSRSAVHERYMRAVADLEQRPAGVPRRLIVFGISSMPGQILEALEGLAGVCQILVCVHNPCEHYWADIVADRDLLRARRRRQARRPDMPEVLDETTLHSHAHPLLAAWGRQGRDYIALLDEHDDPARRRHVLEGLDWERIDFFEPHGEACLLHQLQEDIRALRPLGETREAWPPVDPADASVRFHVAHSPLREVEILHDRLLALFDADPDLRPRDVIVMVPDINVYAPYIDAVFGQRGPDEPGHIPYTLADQGPRGRDPVLIALERLLALPESRMGVSEVLDLLDVPAVRRRFGLGEDDLAALHRWAEASGVRWGLDARQRAGLGLPGGLEQNTWRFGLRRMLLGYAVGDGEAWQAIEPFAESGGLAATLLGPLDHLIEALSQAWEALRRAQSPEDWAACLHGLLQDFFLGEDEDELLSLRRLEDALEQWREDCEAAGLTEALPLTVVREQWLASQEEAGVGQRFLAGAVNFGTLMPMRAIPFRAVCLLGMNDGDYPRRPTPVDFDLMTRDYRPGDRSRREDDRYLFLEALLSARDHLHVSWVGRSVRDNEPRPPSVLVAQLRDHLAAGWQPAGETPLLEQLTIEHPLQPFAPVNFPAEDPDPVSTPARHFTYAAEWEAVHAAPAAGAAPADALAEDETLPPPAPEAEDAVLGPETLVRLLKDPVEVFFAQRLGVHFDEDPGATEDLEPFGVAGLEGWQLRQRLVATALEDGEIGADEDAQAWLQRRRPTLEAESRRLLRAGHLPLGAAGELQRTELIGDAERLLERIAEPLQAFPRRAPALPAVRVAAAGWQLEALPAALRIPPERAPQEAALQLESTVSRLKDKKAWRIDKLVGAWVRHLVACAARADVETRLVGLDTECRFVALDRASARAHLETLLEGWAAALERPLPLAAAAAGAWLRAGDEDRDAHAAALRVLEGDGYHEAGELARRPALARAWPDPQALLADPAMAYWAERLYRPLFDSLSTGEETA